MEGRQDLPAPALDPGPVEAAGSRVSCTPAPRSGFLWPPSDPTPACPRHQPPRGPRSCLTMLRILCVWLCSGSGRGGMCTHSGTVTVPPSRSATITSSCGPKGASGQRATGQSAGPGVSPAWSSPAWSSEADAEQGPHQLLGLCLEGSVDSDDEGCGRAEHLQELRRQDGHVRETATGQGSARQPEGQGGAEGLRGSGQR